MKTKLIAPALLLLGVTAFAQQAPPRPAPAPEAGATFTRPFAGKRMLMHRRGELGQWWKNSEIASKLQVNEGQVQQLDAIYYQHRMRLIDLGADLEKQELRMQELLNAANADDGAVLAQVDAVNAARGKLHREFTSMTLDLRRVLTPDQWKQLQSIRDSRRPDKVFFRHAAPPGGGTHEVFELPAPPPEPPDPME